MDERKMLDKLFISLGCSDVDSRKAFVLECAGKAGKNFINKPSALPEGYKILEDEGEAKEQLEKFLDPRPFDGSINTPTEEMSELFTHLVANGVSVQAAFESAVERYKLVTSGFRN